MSKEQTKGCVLGCKVYEGGERYHHEDCPYYPESMSFMLDKLNLKNFDKLATRYGMDIEIRFTRKPNVIVGDRLIPIKDHFTLFDDIEEQCKAITAEGQKKLMEIAERLKNMDPNIFPDNLFDEEDD